MTRLLLIRHGHVEGIDVPRFRGREDVPLTALGRRQAEATARRLAGHWRIDALQTSPLQRCVETAAPIAAACGVSSSTLASLIDLDYGDWQWKTHAEMRDAAPALFERWKSTPQLMRFPGGESLQDLVGRVADALRELLERHADATVALVSHDSAIRALLLQLLNQPLSAYWSLQQQPCAISEALLDGVHLQVLRINETAHLDALVDAAG